MDFDFFFLGGSGGWSSRRRRRSSKPATTSKPKAAKPSNKFLGAVDEIEKALYEAQFKLLGVTTVIRQPNYNESRKTSNSPLRSGATNFFASQLAMVCSRQWNLTEQRVAKRDNRQAKQGSFWMPSKRSWEMLFLRLSWVSTEM